MAIRLTRSVNTADNWVVVKSSGRRGPVARGVRAALSTAQTTLPPSAVGRTPDHCGGTGVTATRLEPFPRR